MAQKLITTSELVGKRVFADKSSAKKPDAAKKLGKVRHCVFHPSQRRCVGFIVKRPDLLWMFRRRDVFVALNGYDVVDGRILVKRAPEATDKGACKALGVNWDDCVLWVGLPVVGEDGTAYGLVGDVTFDRRTGEVESLQITQGATANALLGVKEIPASMIRGFKRGIGSALNVTGEGEEPVLGAILVGDEVAELSAEGGLAAKAGEATAVVAERARETVESVKPAVSSATKAAGKAVNKGAYATGRQIKRASGMFAAFKEEYDKARHEDD
ncbi:MAG: PRC-barrel domain protein [Adlercreutzia sp.]|uniref:PRC-barrel domain-containing protein n=1 Tax=uncultured Adlercreutzia sp. TaxID=875803 RepID=UPI00217141B5|nr:PRC-barrel domain-containing protein [uncultured Adlercreutzia sp.]MCI8424955.1 PRC-barrel domain protein [Adlercreutzia sp.]